MTREPDGPWYYQQVDLGYNYRMTELQAALGETQLERLTEYVDRRNELAERYDALLADLPVRRPQQLPDARSARHLYVIRVGAGSRSRREVFESLRENGIGVNVHYIPVHTQPYYRAMGFRPEQFPAAMDYYAEAISLPLYPTMTEDQQDAVVGALTRAIEV
jgi:dTDP-4-amino-4,6-dideoxygalactose transaminase